MSAGFWWIIVAALLAGAELLVPGVFLIFLAAAAAITGLATLILADLPLVVQLGSFGVWSVVAVLIGRRWYGDYPIETSDPLLNDRTARLIGSEVIVEEAIVGGRGRVRVGDGSWPAAGPDLSAGARAWIARVDGGVIHVAAVDEEKRAPGL